MIKIIEFEIYNQIFHRLCIIKIKYFDYNILKLLLNNNFNRINVS
jgi:hypothetical protein